MCTCVLRLGCFLFISPVFYFVPPFSFQPFLMFTSEFNERSRSNPLCDFRLGTVATSDHEKDERNDRKDSWNQNNTKIQRHRHRAAPHPDRGPGPSDGRVTPEKKKESCSEGSVVTKRYRRRRTEEQGARSSQSRAVRLLEPPERETATHNVSGTLMTLVSHCTVLRVGESLRERGGRGGRKRKRKRNRTPIRVSDDSVSKQRTKCTIIPWPLTGMSKVLCKNDYEGPMVKPEGARDV